MKLNSNPKTFADHTTNFLIREARKAGNPSVFWCNILNLAKGNVAGIVYGFRIAGVSETNIVKLTIDS